MAVADDIGLVSGKLAGPSVADNVGNGGVGAFVGASVILPTIGDGTAVGLSVGPVGVSIAGSVGTAVGDAVGCNVVDSIGATVGIDIGDNDGTSIGA